MDKLEHTHISPNHLQKKAIVYIRQSSEHQVRNNTESQRLQYALKTRAEAFGWCIIEIIDEDLGKSASSCAGIRTGFERMINEVTRGEVGIIFSREVSRLSRSNKDWCHLFEACGMYYTLIGDEQHIYDPNTMDDQLVLGIKATLSVVELKILQMRLLAGVQEKAKRGKLKMLLPPGYIWNSLDNVVKTPDKRVQDSIEMVFTKFMYIQSIRQTYLWFHNNNIELPVNKFHGGCHRLEWKLPTLSFINSVLKNPFYAGAYVYGRRVTEKHYKDGRIIKRIGRVLPVEESRVLIKEHHASYIDWECFERIQTMIAKNNLNLKGDDVVGAAREGQGLLCGILRCGHCGRKLHVRYWGKQGTAGRYLCKGDFDSGGSYCIGFGSSLVDREFSKQLLSILSPYGIAASIQAIEELSCSIDDQQKVLQQKLQQLTYEQSRAFEQYNEVDPRNRLVAQELEKRWNKKLEQVEQVKEQLEEFDKNKQTLNSDEQKQLIQLGEKFSYVWESEHCPPSIKKKIIRIVIEEVIVSLCKETNILTFSIHWQGGCHTQFSMPKPLSSREQKTSEDDLEIIRKMANRYGDDEIARVLTKLGRRTAKGNRWNKFRVKSIRNKNGIASSIRLKNSGTILSLNESARYCGISHKSIEKMVAQGILQKQQIVPFAPWEIKKTDLDSEKIQRIIKHLNKTGKLIFFDKTSATQLSLFDNEE